MNQSSLTFYQPSALQKEGELIFVTTGALGYATFLFNYMR